MPPPSPQQHHKTARLPGSQLLSGGALLFLGASVVNLGNYLFNLALGRWLGPALFADVSLILTLFLVVTFVTMALQTAAARFVAASVADGDADQVAVLRQWLSRRAWVLGSLVMLVGVLGAPLLQDLFTMTSWWPFVLFALGMPFYFVQGVDRGVLQGQMRFGPLALSYQAEMWLRLVPGLAFVALGLAVNGAILALTISVVASWLVCRAALRAVARPARPLEVEQQRAVLVYLGPVVVALLGQVLIHNSDVVIVRRFFAAAEAGQYAALALIGRIVFFATWSVVTALFPMVAQRKQRGESHRHLLVLALVLVALVSGGITGVAWLVPETMILVLFGAAYVGVAPLVWLYAAATGLYALANVVVHYRLALDDARGGWLVLAAGLAQVGVLWLWHPGLYEVILVQVALMGLLLAVLLGWELWRRIGEDRLPEKGMTAS